MTLFEQNLRGEVLWGPTYRVGPSIPHNSGFRKAEICDFYVPISVDQNVLWLETGEKLMNFWSKIFLLSIDDIFGMEIFQGQDNLGRVKSGPEKSWKIVVI